MNRILRRELLSLCDPLHGFPEHKKGMSRTSRRTSPYSYRTDQPFKPVKVTPRTKVFCIERNTIRMGITLMVAPVMTRPISLQYCPWNILRPRGSVY